MAEPGEPRARSGRSAESLQRVTPSVLRPVPAFSERTAPEDEGAASLHYYLSVVRRRRWVVAAILVSVVVVTILQVFTATPLYRASATLQVDPESDNVLPYRQISGAPQQLQRGEYLWTQTEKLKTRSLATRVVEGLGMAEDPRFEQRISRGVLLDLIGGARALVGRLLGSGASAEEEVSGGRQVDRLLNGLSVRPLRSTRLIEISYSSPDPALSADVVDTFADEFIEQHLESKYDATARATEFLQEQLEDLKQRVERSEEELLSYARAKNIVNYDERESISRKRLADLSDESTRNETQLIELEARARAARAAQGGSFPEVLKNESLRDLERRLYQQEQQIASLRGRFGAEWPDVKEGELTAAELRQQIDLEQQRLIESAEREYRLTLDRNQRLAGSVDAQRELVDRLNEDSIQYRILQREVETNKDLYEGLLQRLKEAGVAAGLKSSNIQIVDDAAVPHFADSPQKARSLMLALAAGLLLGLTGAFVMEGLDNTLKSTDEVVEYVGLPSLGVVPRMSEGLAVGSRQLRLPGRESSSAPVLAFSDSEPNYDRASEAFRSLRTSILLSHADKPPRSLLITSALPNEGKTTAAANVAIALAQSGAPTLLVDLDLRKPSLGSLFDVAADQGLTNYLSGESEVIQIRRTRFENLFLAPSGPVAPNPSELLGSAKLGAGLELLQQNFAHLVIDAPPCLELSDALVVASKIDGVILVARAGRTPKEAVRRAGDQILGVGGRVLGVLVNDVDSTGTADGYYYKSTGSYYDTVSTSGDSSSQDGFDLKSS